jgi:predicted component of type VI protein secretion system
MALYLLITSGTAAGQTFEVRHDAVLGRGQASVIIDDPKISGRHAKIEARAAGGFWLVDLGSVNKIVVASKKETELQLTPGARFRLGRTSFEVIERAASAEMLGLIAAQAPPAAARPTDRHPSERPKTESQLIEFLDRCLQSLSQREAPKVRAIEPLATPLSLKFTRGLQVGETWVVGYCPRVIGSASLDLCIEDASVPNYCLELVATPTGSAAIVHESAKGKVTINGEAFNRKDLTAGDKIEIGENTIEVSFV